MKYKSSINTPTVHSRWQSHRLIWGSVLQSLRLFSITAKFYDQPEFHLQNCEDKIQKIERHRHPMGKIKTKRCSHDTFQRCLCPIRATFFLYLHQSTVYNQFPTKIFVCVRSRNTEYKSYFIKLTDFTAQLVSFFYQILRTKPFKYSPSGW